MANYHIVRGSELRWRMSFYDEQKNPTSPPDVSLYVSYKQGGQPKVDVVNMTGELDGVFTAVWDSSPADAGFVYWHVRAKGGSPHAIEGQVVLLANPANPGQT